MRIFLTFLGALICVAAGAAEIPASATLDEVLSLATRQEPSNIDLEYHTERCSALKRLGEWPKTSAADETRITDALLAALSERADGIKTAGIWSLGDRGHSEAIPAIITLGEKQPIFIQSFFQRYLRHPHAEPPVKFLRPGLLSKNWSVQYEILRAIVSCKAVALRADVEAVLDSDSSDTILVQAALALGELGLRESVPALRRAFAKRPQLGGAAWALTQVGDEADITAMIPLLRSKDEDVRRNVASVFSSAKIGNSRAACDALLETLNDPSESIQMAAVEALAHFKDPRALVPIRELLKRPVSWHDHWTYVEAISAIGGKEALTLLNDMVAMGWLRHFGLEKALIHYASPSSARAVWKEYLKNPIRANPGSDVLVTGYFEALDVLAACADSELFLDIRVRKIESIDPHEKAALGELLERIKARLNR